MSYASVAANNTSIPTHPLVINDNIDDDNAPKSKPKRSSKHLREVEAEGLYLWQIAKHYMTRPGLFGIINIGLLAFAGHKFYRYPHLRRDVTAISASFAACIILMTAEGYATTKYRQTLQAQKEERKVKKEGTVIFRQFDKHIGSLGVIASLVNTVVLGTVGYWSYVNWNKPWDRRAVSAISVGLVALWSGEGFLAKQYRRKET